MKEMITIQNSDGTTLTAELVTYLVSEDGSNKYIVYSKGEKTNDALDEIIYISKVLSQPDGSKKIDEIVDDNEWLEVQKLLKKIANS